MRFPTNHSYRRPGRLHVRAAHRRHRRGPRQRGGHRRGQHLLQQPAVAGVRHAGPDRVRRSFPYSQDGAVFQNREGVLPSQSTGYYHEYTVITPGSSTRGAKRIVTGKKTQEDYYTSDHYVTFKLINFGC